MSRVCVKKASVCTSEPLVKTDVCRKVALFRSLLSSCYGPGGKLKLIHNNVGGICTTTTTSSVLLRSVSVCDPLLRLVTSAVIKQTTRFSDCGLLTGLFCTSLVENAVSLGLRSGLVTGVYSHLFEECQSFLCSDDCGCRVKVDFSTVQSLLSLVHSMITSKPGSMLTPDEAQHITRLMVRAFLRSIPTDSSSEETHLGKTLMVTMEGQTVMSSMLFSGLLVDIPVLESLQNLRPGPYKVVLFSASLSGDLSEIAEVLDAPVEDDPERLVLDLLLKLGDRVVRDDVGVFACQKVIHPVLQNYLREHGLVVMERLGLALMEPLAQMTGSVILASLSVCDEAYGLVSGLHLHHLGSKMLLQLIPHQEVPFSTVVLCHRSKTMLEELQVTCQRAEDVLRLTLQEPYALLGGGCTETQLLAHVKRASELKVAEMSLALKCSRSEFLLCAEAFYRSLQSVVLSLDHVGQHILVDMGNKADMHSHCGFLKGSSDQDEIILNSPLKIIDSPPRPLDSFSAKLNALRVAVETATLILDVKYIVTDIN